MRFGSFWVDYIYVRLWTYSRLCNGLRLRGNWDGVNILCMWQSHGFERAREQMNVYWIVSPPNTLKLHAPVHINVILFEIRVFCRCNHVTMRSSWVRVELNPIYWCPYEKRRDLCKEGWYHATTEEGLELSGYKLKCTKDCQQLPEAKKDVIEQIISLWDPKKAPTLPTSWFHTSGLQNSETIYFCCW